jgi:ubiquinone/menaquinone biosynthesis C-methylase UbiE
MTSEWVKFYDFRHSIIYVNERHRDVHYARIANDIVPYIPSPNARVLDYGSGEALHADEIAVRCASLVLAEAAPNVRAILKQRFAGNPKITVMSPEEVAALPDRSFDLIVMHSVAQYLTAQELGGLLATFRRLVAAGGMFVLGDIVPPKLASVNAAMLRFAAQNGFLGAAIVGLIRIFLSDYLKLSKKAGLAHYNEAQMLDRLRGAGFRAERAPRNIGHNPTRMTFLGRPSS